jgi:hypothetical protein
MKTLWLLLMVVFLTPSAFAGWSSGGGELIKDAKNPWFIQNTKTVRYCVLVDESNFGMSRDAIEKLVPLAIGQWKEEFKRAITFPNNSINAQVATQEFVATACDDQTDLRFQFGILTGDQLQKIGDPKRYIGITIRTEYDHVNLKGKGFMYFSPERGPLKLDDDKLVVNPWSDLKRSRLHWVLLHELGHVFGLGHDSDGFNMMNDRFAETLLLKKDYNELPAPGVEPNEFLPRPSYFKFDGTQYYFTMCSATSSPPVSIPNPVEPTPMPNPMTHSRLLQSEPTRRELWKDFFGIDDSKDCFTYDLKDRDLNVYAWKSTGDKELVGRANLEKIESYSEIADVVSLWMTDKQKVFPNLEIGNYSSYAVTYRLRFTHFKGTYVSVDKTIKRQVILQAEPSGYVRIGGIMNNQIYLNIFSGY